MKGPHRTTGRDSEGDRDGRGCGPGRTAAVDATPSTLPPSVDGFRLDLALLTPDKPRTGRFLADGEFSLARGDPYERSPDLSRTFEFIGGFGYNAGSRHGSGFVPGSVGYRSADRPGSRGLAMPAAVETFPNQFPTASTRSRSPAPSSRRSAPRPASPISARS